MDLVLLLFLIYLKICEHFILKENFMNFFSENNVKIVIKRKFCDNFLWIKNVWKYYVWKYFYEKFLLKNYFFFKKL